MLLRMLVIIGLATAAARPSRPEAKYELSTREMLTLFGIIAAALLALWAGGCSLGTICTRSLPSAHYSGRSLLRDSTHSTASR